jgi:hypothetical protein
VTLGRSAAPIDDPYVLVDRWLSIEVDSEGDGFAVLVRTSDVEDAHEVLERAKRFAKRRDQSGDASPASDPASTVGQAAPLQKGLLLEVVGLGQQ